MVCMVTVNGNPKRHEAKNIPNFLDRKRLNIFHITNASTPFVFEYIIKHFLGRLQNQPIHSAVYRIFFNDISNGKEHIASDNTHILSISPSKSIPKKSSTTLLSAHTKIYNNTSFSP